MIEYKHIAKSMAGSGCFVISNFKRQFRSSEFFCDVLSGNLNVQEESILRKIPNGIPRSRVCLLDSEATETLSPEDATLFDCFLAGGILGDVDENDPDRTSELRVHGFPARNLGREQMTLDTAILAASRVVTDKIPLAKISFCDRPTFALRSSESIEMPFRYLADSDGRPVIPDGIIDLWMKDDDVFN